MRKFFAAALAATTLFASCSKEGGEGNGTPKEGPQTAMGITFTMPMASSDSRANTGDEITATEDENKFSKMKIFIFKSDGSAATGNNTERALTDFAVDGNTYTLLANKQVETTAGAKRIYIGLNLPSTMDNFATEQALKTAVDFVIPDLVTSGGVAMISDVIVHSLVTQEDGSVINPANQISASLERMVAKVAANVETSSGKYTVDANTDGSGSVEYTIDMWGIGQCTNRMYPAKQFENSKLVTPRATDDSPAVWAHPAETDMIAITKGAADWTVMSSIYVGENAPRAKLIGESTYAMVRAKAVPIMKATFDGSDIQFGLASGALNNGFWVTRAGGKTYFCENETKAREIYDHLGGKGLATVQEYQGGYVYFIVWLNKNITGEELIVKRNQYVHIEITGIAAGVFGGLPGDDEDPDGETPPDPFDPPGEYEPDPLDPDDPVIDTPAFLNVKVTVKPWIYAKNTTVLGE